MATNENRKMTKAEKVIEIYDERLEDIRSIDPTELSFENLEELSKDLESELSTLDRKKCAVLPMGKRASFKDQYNMLIRTFRSNSEVLRTLDDQINELLKEFKKGERLIEDEMTQPRERNSPNVSNKFEHMKADPLIVQSKSKRMNTKYDEFMQALTDQNLTDPTIRNALSGFFENKLSGTTSEIEQIEYFDTECNQLFESLNDEIAGPLVRSELKQLFEDELSDISSESEEDTQLIKRRYKYVIQALINEERKETTVRSSLNKRFETQLSNMKSKFDKMKSDPLINEAIQRRMQKQYDQFIQELISNFIKKFLPQDIKDSLEIIEKTLAEPELYSLPSLIMWRDTAIEKIAKIKNKPNYNVPKPIEAVIIEKYEALIKHLRAEILKLRTYPIPEDWQSEAMRDGLTHVIKGEFVFHVDRSLMEEMEPLEPWEINPLPGGLTREEYDTRLLRLYKDCEPIYQQLEARNVFGRDRKLDTFAGLYSTQKEHVLDTFREFPLLYRDKRTLVYLVNKNDDDQLLKDILRIICRKIRHYRDNRIDIPSFAIDANDSPMIIAPPKQERNIPIASGIDRGALVTLQLNTPSAVIVEGNSVVTADRYSHYVTWYRANDLAPCAGTINLLIDTPLSLVIFQNSLYACYQDQLSQFSMTKNLCLELSEISKVHHQDTIKIPECCCVAANDEQLFVGTLKPSLILINADTFQVEEEYPMSPIRYHTRRKKNRYPWLQDMKTARNHVFCLFTGSPSPLQMFSLTGAFVCTILAEDRIVGAYSFNIHLHPLEAVLTFYICDFWGNDVKVFDYNGKCIETICEKGDQLGKVVRPTAIFIERTGYITVCDLKEDNCMQRL